MEERGRAEPEMERSVRLKMERCAAFVASMIEKYGRDVLEELKQEEVLRQKE